MSVSSPCHGRRPAKSALPNSSRENPFHLGKKVKEVKNPAATFVERAATEADDDEEEEEEEGLITKTTAISMYKLSGGK